MNEQMLCKLQALYKCSVPWGLPPLSLQQVFMYFLPHYSMRYTVYISVYTVNIYIFTGSNKLIHKSEILWLVLPLGLWARCWSRSLWQLEETRESHLPKLRTAWFTCPKIIAPVDPRHLGLSWTTAFPERWRENVRAGWSWAHILSEPPSAWLTSTHRSSIVQELLPLGSPYGPQRRGWISRYTCWGSPHSFLITFIMLMTTFCPSHLTISTRKLGTGCVLSHSSAPSAFLVASTMSGTWEAPSKCLGINERRDEWLLQIRKFKLCYNILCWRMQKLAVAVIKPSHVRIRQVLGGHLAWPLTLQLEILCNCLERQMTCFGSPSKLVGASTWSQNSLFQGTILLWNDINVNF